MIRRTARLLKSCELCYRCAEITPHENLTSPSWLPNRSWICRAARRNGARNSTPSLALGGNMPRVLRWLSRRRPWPFDIHCKSPCGSQRATTKPRGNNDAGNGPAGNRNTVFYEVCGHSTTFLEANGGCRQSMLANQMCESLVGRLVYTV